ncbi:uncharacterized protein LOC116851584 isoform X1 [Odontomachus brunneus]|uniref:uncharacterized protein LOC116851584 isoform X1 n=1 Tax=Odontomachus brunneus TaxID=486640 RepID=UPI0013F1F4B3|nr:uncharacterized protein LOC116851584 isoform X1 [Odontomachus brunneus]XP_032687036.1 uncharacterized protein LOC116851584 isoform X1 [Odontomachus brunneus]
MNSAVDSNCARGSYKSYLRNDREVPQSTLRSRAIAVVTSNVDNAQCSQQLQLNDVTMDMEHEYPYSIDVQQQSRSWNIHGNSEYNDLLSVSSRSNSDNEEMLSRVSSIPNIPSEEESSNSYDNDTQDDDNSFHEDNYDNSDNDAFEDAEDIEKFEYIPGDNNTRDSLYEGSRISKEEGYLLLLHFTIRHHLSDVALEHLIELIDLLLPIFVFRKLTSLHEKGIIRNVNGQKMCIKIHTIVSPVDSVARPILQEIVQYNGRYGCSFCLHEGQQVTVGRGSTRVYPGDVGSSRTLRQHEQDCKICMQGGKIVRGIKGPSILMLLPVFNIVTSFTPDYLHSILLEVVKTFTEAWFDSAYHDKPWYLGTKTTIFDRKLLKIKPPCEITRTPRSINERKMWKGSEWKHFLLYYPMICMQNVMPTAYLKHWFYLVFSMYILLQEKITNRFFFS